MNLIPVILSGGSGSRLWPLSRSLRPKQFLGVTEERSLFQATLARLEGLVPKVAPIVVANTDHRFLVADQCLQMGVTPHTLILEPVARNTAPAIAVAALQALAQLEKEQSSSSQARGQTDSGVLADESPVLLVLPSDHVIANTEAFHAAVRVGYEVARSGALVTFGIVPTHPETGYGYVKAASDVELADGQGASTRGPPRCRFHRKAQARNRRAILARGRVFLEQRHVHVPGRHLFTRA